MRRLKLHLVDLLSPYYTSTFATNTVTNRTDGASLASVVIARCDKQRSIVDVIARCDKQRSIVDVIARCDKQRSIVDGILLTSVNGVLWRNFLFF